MMNYENFWKTLERKGLTQCALVNEYGISTSVFARMRKNEYLGLRKIADLCKILECEIEDIVVYVPDK